jgi:hypothetical protein
MTAVAATVATVTVVTPAAVAAIATIATIAAVMTTAMAAAAIRAAAASAATGEQAGFSLVLAADQGNPDQGEEQSNTKNNNAVHSRILQNYLQVP